MKSVAYKVKTFLPPYIKKPIRNSSRALKMKIGVYIGCVLPDFIIIGAQKCGTTSLYNSLIQHPCIHRASIKEVGFFDRHYHKGISWYRSQFPFSIHKYHVTKIRKRDFITGEASTGYILNPHALKRISETLPNVKLILMLRNPVDRAISHYHHTSRMGRETLSFEEALREESRRLGCHLKKMMEIEGYFNINISRYAYTFTGLYINQIKELMKSFSRDQVLILRSEDFFNDTERVYLDVLRFLDLPPSNEILQFKKYNVGNYDKKKHRLREKLIDYFKPYNKRLYAYLERDFGWDK